MGTFHGLLMSIRTLLTTSYKLEEPHAVHIHVHTHANIHIQIQTHKHTHTHTHKHTHTHIHTCAQFINTQTERSTVESYCDIVCAYMYIYAYTHLAVHMHTPVHWVLTTMNIHVCITSYRSN